MQQQSEDWRSQAEFSSLDSHISYDSDMPETDSQSSQEETDSHSSQEETNRLSSHMETDSQSSQMETDRLSSGETARLSSGMKDSPEIKASQAVSVPVPPNTAVGPRTRTRHVSRSLEDTKYVKTFFYKQRLGSETSTMEFKQGLGDPPKSLKINTGEYKGTFVDNLRKYATAFLNNEGGTLMIGVDDSGQVLGNKINFHQQDKYQQTADSVFMNFKPRVWPGSNYCVAFVPVVAGVEEIPPGETPDLKDLMVLCITFKRPAGCRELYRTLRTEQGKAFIRGNGSVQQMTTDAIHDWYKQKWTDEVEKLAKENDEQKRVIMDLQTKQNSSPTHQKRKMTAPASEEADKKSPRLGKNGSMAVAVMEKNEDDEDRKVLGEVYIKRDGSAQKMTNDEIDDLYERTWSEEEGQKRLRRKQSSQHRRPLQFLASGNTVMKENTVRPMKEKTGRIPSLRSSVGERGGAENSSVGRPQRKESDRALI